MNILLLHKPSEILAPWHAAEAHFGYIHECAEPIIIIVNIRYLDDLNQNWTNKFKPIKVLTFNSMFQLLKIVFAQRKDRFFCITFREVIIIHLFSLTAKAKSFFWVQGIVPEEDYLRTKSFWRKTIISFAEKIAFRLSYANIFVSEYMVDYMVGTRKIKSNRHIVVPCTSDLTYKGQTKIDNSYVYIGGLSAWQKIGKMLEYFNEIAKENPESKLFLFTFNTNEMYKIMLKFVDESNRNNVTIKRLDNRFEIEENLSKMQYGFLIRDEDPINNVSSPIKLAEYLSCGVNILISGAVSSYAQTIEDAKCGLTIDNINDLEKLRHFKPSTENALQYYEQTFNKKKIINNYRKLLNN